MPRVLSVSLAELSLSDPTGLRGTDPPTQKARSQRAVRMLVAGAVIILAMWTIRSYIASIAWAVVIVIGIWPYYRRFAPHSAVERKWCAPLLATLSIALVLIIPGFLAFAEIGREGRTVLRWIAEVQQNGIQVPDWLSRLPVLGDQIAHWWKTHLSDPQGIQDLVGGLGLDSITSWICTLGGEVCLPTTLNKSCFCNNIRSLAARSSNRRAPTGTYNTRARRAG